MLILPTIKATGGNLPASIGSDARGTPNHATSVFGSQGFAARVDATVVAEFAIRTEAPRRASRLRFARDCQTSIPWRKTAYGSRRSFGMQACRAARWT